MSGQAGHRDAKTMPHFLSSVFSPALLRCLMALAMLLGAAGCHREAPSSASIRPSLRTNELARVGDVVISLADFQAERVRHPSTLSNDEFLGHLIRREQLFAEATSTGFDRSPQLQAAWKALVAARFEESLIPPHEPAAPVSETELAAHHALQTDRFTTPESIRAALIQFVLSPTAPEERRQEVLSRAATVRNAAGGDTGDPETFHRLAREYSQHAASRRLGGDLGWLTRGQAAPILPSEVVAQLFTSTQPGRITPVLVTSEGVFLVQTIEHRPARIRPLQEVREQVRRDWLTTLAARARASVNERLHANHPVDINAACLSELASRTPAESAVRPPRLPAP